MLGVTDYAAFVVTFVVLLIAPASGHARARQSPGQPSAGVSEHP